MLNRVLVGFLLIAVCIPVLGTSPVNSQSSVTTTTMKLAQPPSGKCAERWVSFRGQAGTEIAGTFGADHVIGFYILSQQDFVGIQNQQCQLPAGATPLYSQTGVSGFDNRYQSLAFPASDTYYFVFTFTPGPTDVAYATLILSYPASTVIVGGDSPTSSSSSQTSSIIVNSKTSSSSSVSFTSTTRIPENVTPACECSAQILNFAPSNLITATLPKNATNTFATVSFEVRYSGIPSGYYLDLGLSRQKAPYDAFDWWPGGGQLVGGSSYDCGFDGKTHCIFHPSSTGGGTNSVTFTLNLNSTVTSYYLEARVYVLDSAYYPVRQGTNGPYYDGHSFTVSVRTETPETAATPGWGITIPGVGTVTLTPVTLFQSLAGAAGAAFLAILTQLLRTRKRRLFTKYLSKIEATRKEYAMNQTELVVELEDMKRDIIQLLSKGKIEDSHFQLLDAKIDEYLQTFSGRAPPPAPPPK